jgi:hypothetical protein
MLEIFFDDLDEETQQKVLGFYNIHSPEEMNFEVVPLFVLERGDSEDRG